LTTLAFPARTSARAGRGSLYVIAFAAAAVGAGTGRAVTTTYLPVLLDRIDDAPGLIGLVMLVNAGAGFSVPLVIGYWSDQRRARGLGARLPFVLGGSLLAAGGLTAVALGASSTYLALAVFAATVYVGLNAITTAIALSLPSCSRVASGHGRRAHRSWRCWRAGCSAWRPAASWRMLHCGRRSPLQPCSCR